MNCEIIYHQFTPDDIKKVNSPVVTALSQLCDHRVGAHLRFMALSRQ